MQITACGQTDLGQRRENNEDALLVDAENGLFVVADGVGGHAAGEVASKLVTEKLTRALAAHTGNLAEAIKTVHGTIRAATQANSAWQGMATTVVALSLDGDRGIIANVGDSRAYRLRDEALEQISLDHNLASEQRRAGAVELYPGAEHILTMVLGGEGEPQPHVEAVEMRPGDRYLLCTDGLTGMVDEATIAAIVAAVPTPEEGCRQLVALANAGGGRDNITVLLVFVTD